MSFSQREPAFSMTETLMLLGGGLMPCWGVMCLGKLALECGRCGPVTQSGFGSCETCWCLQLAGIVWVRASLVSRLSF